MSKIKKNNFLFILLISLVTLILLIVGALTLYKDNSSTFSSEGYIIEATTKTNQKYYFKENTKYKFNVDNKISFKDTESNDVSVTPASFVHYLNGNISFLQRGALVNLSDLNSPMVPYYNITKDTTITKETNNYTVNSNEKKINIESFVGRISDNKYIIAGNDIELKIPNVEDRIKGEYFEILFIEEGIIKIDNQEASYQVTAQDSYIYVGDNITINLGDGKIFYDGDVKMLLSQITINGDENIDLDVDDKNGTGLDGTGSGGGADSSGGADGDGAGAGGEEDGTGLDGTGLDGNGTGNGNGNGNGEGGDKTTASPQIELIEATVTSTTINASLQLNNAALAEGSIIAYLTNVQTGKREYSKNIDLVNGTFTISKESLSPSTEYALTISETNNSTEKQYFQKVFRTKDLGLTLEKAYATSDSLSYNIIFDENSEVTRAHITIYDNNGSNTAIYPNEFTITSNDADSSATFTGLKSNTSYSISIDTIWINNAAYSNVYTINRIDSTLKETPTISGVNVETNSEEIKFTLSLDKVTDKDKSIVSYVYNFYKADDITLDNPEPDAVYSVTKNDTDALTVNLNEVKELKTGVDYRCKIVALYDDNELIREVSTDYSANFLIRSKPSIDFETDKIGMNYASGTLTLIDANCTVPMNGRSCSSSGNNFTLKYYKMKDGETNSKEITFTNFDNDLKRLIELEELSANTTYGLKLYGTYIDDNNIEHPNVQIGETFYITTDKSEELYFEPTGDNKSDNTNVVTFNARLTAPEDEEHKKNIEDIATITLNLYSGRYNTKDKLIGTYTITDKNEIEDFFNSKTITNGLFQNLTPSKNKYPTLNSNIALKAATNNSTNTLASAYTVEVEDVYDEGKVNKFHVEDNLYTFNLTPTYYLDERISSLTDSDKKKLLNVITIKKEDLTESEYNELKRTITNLDDLNDDTIVGVTIENSLSDILVDSAFTYEKVTVNYLVNNTLNDNKNVKQVSLEMGNKYQPSSQTIYLDPSNLDDGSHFTRGYKYQVGYTLTFLEEEGKETLYENEYLETSKEIESVPNSLNKAIVIDKQDPIYTQYISTSNSESITYRYSITDIDKALKNNKFYYTLGDSKEPVDTNKTINTDGNYHEVTFSFSENTDYTIQYFRKNAKENKDLYVEFNSYNFEKEIKYNNELSYEIINNYNNNLTIKLEENNFTERSAAYKVVLKADGVTDYSRYFLSSKLDTIDENTGELDEEGNEITKKYKIIAIDYANISKFMKKNIKVSVYSYYDNGLVGLDQNFDYGMILKDSKNKKYLNIHNTGVVQNANVSTNVSNDIMGINYLSKTHNIGDASISLYNKLLGTSSYNPTIGSAYYDLDDTKEAGLTYDVSFTNEGAVLTYNKTDYRGFNARLLSEANLKTNDNNYKFDEIIPTINVTTNNTINSIKVNINPSGIYGNDQFKKDNTEHNKLYIDFYSDEELTNKLTSQPLTTDITIVGNEDTGYYTATVAQLEYNNNLQPDTTYYFTVYAYINNKYTRLYDSSSKGKYITKTYSGKTLGPKDILSSIMFSVVPVSYAGETSKKELSWRLNLKNTENYKIRFELYDQSGKSINFDGTIGTSCNINNIGDSSNGYVNGCYISVPTSDINQIKNTIQKYNFTGNDFVFGDNYYKLVVYAIPYYQDTYKEDQKITLYKNDSLTNMNNANIDGVIQTINIQELKEADLNAVNIDSGYVCRDSNSNGCNNGYYYVSFNTSNTDESYVLKYGKYQAILRDSSRNIVGSNQNETCTYYDNGTLKTASECSITLDASSINKKIEFANLKANSRYYIELTYDTYRNNVGYTETQKTDITPFTDSIFTPPPEKIKTLGYISANQLSNKQINLTYNAFSANITTDIVLVKYNISLMGGSSKVSGTISINSSNPSIFTINPDKSLSMLIDVSENSDNQNFTFKSGNDYLINTQYYYDNAGTNLFEDELGLSGINNFSVVYRYN